MTTKLRRRAEVRVDELEKRVQELEALLQGSERENERLLEECWKLTQTNAVARRRVQRERERYIDLYRDVRKARKGQDAQLEQAHTAAGVEMRNYKRLMETAAAEGDKELANHYFVCMRQAKTKQVLALGE